MSHAECVYAAILSNCPKDRESCGMSLHHVTAQKIMSDIECVYATFSSNCAKDHDSCGMCLLKHGEKTYAFTVIFEMETTLTNDGVRRIQSGF